MISFTSRRMNDFAVSEALKIGFTKAVWLDNLTISCEVRLRAYCNSESCPNHGQNWVCPPGCGSIDECAEKVGRFSAGIALQSVSKLTPPVKADTYKALNRLHNFRLKELLERLSGESAEMLALTTGGCVFCEICAYPEPCIKPDVQMNSLSAYGIDVGRLCGQAGLEYSFRPDAVYYTALVLVKEPRRES